MRSSHIENLTSKVIIRFRYRAGKNGQLFPQKSWTSGFLITSSTGLILASGPKHILLPYKEILSIEDDGSFALEDGPKEKLIPITHAGGIDLYLTLVGVPPLIKNILTKKLYSSIISSYRKTFILSDGKEIPFIFDVKQGTIIIKTDLSDPIEIRPEILKGIDKKIVENGALIYLQMEGRDDIKMIFRGGAGELAMRLLRFIRNEYVPSLNEKQRKILKILSKEPRTTEELTKELDLVQLEGSIMLNELIFLDLVRFDHDMKTYISTTRGSSLLQDP